MKYIFWSHFPKIIYLNGKILPRELKWTEQEDMDRWEGRCFHFNTQATVSTQHPWKGEGRFGSILQVAWLRPRVSPGGFFCLSLSLSFHPHCAHLRRGYNSAYCLESLDSRPTKGDFAAFQWVCDAISSYIYSHSTHMQCNAAYVTCIYTPPSGVAIFFMCIYIVASFTLGEQLFLATV